MAKIRAGGPRDFLWLGLKDPTDEEFAEVNAELGLHPLAVEDAVSGRQRVKIERYGSTIFAAVKTLAYVEQTSDIETGEIMIFVGDHFVVTVRRGDVAPLAPVRALLESHPEQLASEGADGVLHAVLDTVVDTYLEIDVEVADDLETIEEAVFGSNDTAHSGSIYRLKREVLEFRRAASPLTPAVAWLAGEDGPIESAELRLRFRDVSDHLLRVTDHIETYDRLLADIFNAHLAQISIQQNNDMRKISAWVAMAAVPTMVAGIYGMNFDDMPELHWSFGYPLVVALMALACVFLYRAFRRSGWL
ncbi:magnesium/cobalt transporter CorA [Ornithinimicrobium cryptoxanthini]|uniref:magnesium/cobalt transporter CorA n=1 Tax=Ornithinimicrobium cryptoxanthini TaxID=2934161 RepID=UPI002741E05E|nr:magnesium/cobalt transporter CorA [Ornithinimicrobium cryptoxanthini]